MKLFWMFLAITKAQYDAVDATYDADANTYVYDPDYVYDGTVDGLERKRTQAQKEAAKAAKQKAKEAAKYAKTTTTTTEATTSTEATTTEATTTSDPTTIDSYSTVTTDGPADTTVDNSNPYAPGGDTYGESGNENEGGNNNGNYGNNAPGDTPTGGAANLTCFTCNALTVEECLATGELKACLENEESCELEVRTRYNQETEVYDQVGVITGCKQLLACQNNQAQNFFSKTNFQKDKDITQCRPETDRGYDHSVCRQCCWEDDCVANGGNFWDPTTRWQWGQTNGRYGI